MIKIHTLLATAVMLLLVEVTGCACAVLAQTSTEDLKFIQRSESVLGLNREELIEALGQPKEIFIQSCHVPLQLIPEQTWVPLTGAEWIYEYQDETVGIDMAVCVINNHAVAEQRVTGILEGARISTSKQTSFDADLIRKAFKAELDEESYEERTTPQIYTGHKYEI